MAANEPVRQASENLRRARRCCRLRPIILRDNLGIARGSNPFENPRVSSKRNPGEVRRCRAQGRDGEHAGRSQRRGAQAVCRRRVGRGGEGADSRRRPRQGRRREGGEDARRRRDAREKHPGHDAGDAPDRAAGAESAAAADRRDRGHRARALSRHRARPRDGQAGVYGLAGRRHGD